MLNYINECHSKTRRAVIKKDAVIAIKGYPMDLKNYQALLPGA
jgi:hypothetical protein